MRYARLWWGLGSTGLFVAAVIVSSSLAPNPGTYGPTTLPPLSTVTTRPSTTPSASTAQPPTLPPATIIGPLGPPGPAGAPGQVAVVVTVAIIPAPTLPPTTTTATTVPPIPSTTRCRPPPSKPHPSSTTHPCLPTH